MKVVYIDNDNLLRVDNVRAFSIQSGSPINTASITVTVVLSGDTGNGVSGVSWPVALTNVVSGTGTGIDVRGSRWEGVLPDAMSLTADENYQAELAIEAGDGFSGFWVVPLIAKNREI